MAVHTLTKSGGIRGSYAEIISGLVIIYGRGRGYKWAGHVNIKMEDASQLLEAVLSAEGKCDELELSLRSQRDEYLRKKDEQLAALKERSGKLQLKVDSMLARLTRGEEELEELKREQSREAETVEVAIMTEKEKLQEIHRSYDRLQTVVEFRSGPESAMPVPPLTFTLTDFDKMRQKDEIWSSPPFYTHLYGYKMSLQIYTNGTAHGKGTHISVFIALLPGEFDDLLMWPYSGEITVHLLSQKRTQITSAIP